MLDIDHFKSINDSHGHETGDQALGGAGWDLRPGLRENDLLVRLGGEEIVWSGCPIPTSSPPAMWQNALRAAVARLSLCLGRGNRAGLHGLDRGLLRAGLGGRQSSTPCSDRPDAALYRAKDRRAHPGRGLSGRRSLMAAANRSALPLELGQRGREIEAPHGTLHLVSALPARHGSGWR